MRNKGKTLLAGGSVVDIFKIALTRKDGSFWHDAVGCIALFVILVGALHLPALL